MENKTEKILLFNQENYSEIKTACENKSEIEFEAPQEITLFAERNAPIEWTAYPPAFLPDQGYVQVYYYAGNDIRGTLTRLELLVHLNGGRILYKAKDNNRVALKLTWPNKSTA